MAECMWSHGPVPTDDGCSSTVSESTSQHRAPWPWPSLPSRAETEALEAALEPKRDWEACPSLPPSPSLSLSLSLSCVKHGNSTSESDESEGVSGMDGKGLSEDWHFRLAAEKKLPRICSRGLPEDGKDSDGRRDWAFARRCPVRRDFVVPAYVGYSWPWARLLRCFARWELRPLTCIAEVQSYRSSYWYL